MEREMAIFDPPHTMTRPSNSPRLIEFLVSRLAVVLKVSPLALKMFKSANELSGLDKKTLPTELIPLNTLQLSRGLLNFAALQSMEEWVLPYWARRQFDSRDPSFIPRSHLGLSVNVTNRNWTAVGSPDCTIEPVVDPRGMVTPFRNSWSLDIWMKTDQGSLFPSLEDSCHQSLRNGIPVVNTEFTFGRFHLGETVYVARSTLVQKIVVTNLRKRRSTCEIAIAIRPFNPEGIALTHSVRFDRTRTVFHIDQTTVSLPGPPTRVHCSDYSTGDSAQEFRNPSATVERTEVDSPSGLANGFATYVLALKPGESRSFLVSVPLESTAGEVQTAETVTEDWEELLSHGASVTTPDVRLNDMIRASLTTLLMLGDGDSITPGPWTYHQFWFRDAAYMLRALDVFGFHAATRPVIESFPHRQERDGYFRSQKGEWDSNGQALWTVWQHANLTNDRRLVLELYESLSKGVGWIQRKRLTGPDHRGTPWEGLMPKGLSAEHLGLADHYFWDNWWSTAGMAAFLRLGAMIENQQAVASVKNHLREYRAALSRAVDRVCEQKRIEEIPAGPERGIDYGMIGTCVAWYPLQEISGDDPRMYATLDTLERRFTRDGLFFQQFIHSGMNAYLTLHLAHAWLHAGERRKFWKLFQCVLRRASPTMNYPEAIHPLTGGGVMGDGHHGWAAAEVLLAIRDAFVREMWVPDAVMPHLVLLGGIPKEWCRDTGEFSFSHAPVPGGTMAVSCSCARRAVRINFSLQARTRTPSLTGVTFDLPFHVESVKVQGARNSVVKHERHRTKVTLPPEITSAVITCLR